MAFVCLSRLLFSSSSRPEGTCQRRIPGQGQADAPRPAEASQDVERRPIEGTHLTGTGRCMFVVAVCQFRGPSIVLLVENAVKNVRSRCDLQVRDSSGEEWLSRNKAFASEISL